MTGPGQLALVSPSTPAICAKAKYPSCRQFCFIACRDSNPMEHCPYHHVHVFTHDSVDQNPSQANAAVRRDQDADVTHGRTCVMCLV
jgi:hypothetical protein